MHAELGNRWALVMARQAVSDHCASVAAGRLGYDGVTTLIADDDFRGNVLLVRPDAHLGWRGPADPEALDRWLTAMLRHGRAG